MAEHSIFLQELQPPAFIGESAVLHAGGDGLRNASVVARSSACALRLAVQDAPNLVELLGEVTDDEVAKLQEGLTCVWRRFLWSSVHGPYAGEGATEVRRRLLPNEHVRCCNRR